MKTKGGSRLENSRGLNTRDNIHETSKDSRMIQNDSILASGIDVGQGIKVGPGKFGKKNTQT